MSESVKVAVIGLGTVGSGVVRIINEKNEKIKKKYGFSLEVVDCADLSKERYIKLIESGYACGCYYADAFQLLENTTADIVVELIGGYEPARTIIIEALKRGKSVVTANKEVVSRSGEEIFKTAEENGADFFFEAAVGGGIPIIRPLKEMLVANNFSYIAGIVNGTTNYILSRMTHDKLEFEKALKQAQELGYAEPDPRADVEGDDAQAKIAILSSIAFNTRIVKEDVYKEGITSITSRDIRYADELGYVIKLLAYARKEKEGVHAFVRPVLIPKNHPLASVDDVYNAIYLNGDNCGNLMFFGEGAGSLAAGSSVVGDIIEAALAVQKGCRGQDTKCSCFESINVLPMDSFSSKYYVNLKAKDEPGVLASIAGCFGKAKVSIASVIQKESDENSAYIVFMTHTTTEKKMQEALKLIKSLDVVESIENSLVVLDEEVL